MLLKAMEEGRRAGKALGPILLLTLLLGQAATAASYPVNIPYGRSWPLSIVIDSKRGFAYVDGMSGIYPPTGFSFGVINVTSHALVKVLPLDEIPGALALNQASGNVYIAGSDSIQVFNAGNQSMGKTIAVGHPIRSLAYDGSTSKDVFVTAENQVYAVDPQSGKIVGNATIGNGANGMALDSGKLFVAEYPDSEIFVFQARNLTLVGTISLPTCCAAQMAINPKTHLLFATTGTRFVEVIDTRDDALVNNLSVASTGQNSTNTVAVDSETGRAFVSTSPGGSIVELDSSGDTITGEFKVGSQVAGLAVDSGTQELFATNYHQVTVFDISTVHVLIITPVSGAVVAAMVAVGVLLVLRAMSKRGAKR